MKATTVSVPAEEALCIRSARDHDYATIAEIYNESVRAMDATADQVLKTGDDFLGMARGFHEREAILALTRNGVVIGFGVVKRYSGRKGYRYTCEASAYLRRSERRKGYGLKLKRALVEQARTFGYHHVVSKILAGNAASVVCNKKLGYELVGVQKEACWQDGRWMDVVLMQLVLKDVLPESVADGFETKAQP